MAKFSLFLLVAFAMMVGPSVPRSKVKPPETMSPVLAGRVVPDVVVAAFVVVVAAFVVVLPVVFVVVVVLFVLFVAFVVFARRSVNAKYRNF